LRILALDYGDRRIGVAISDELELVARGLTTLIRKNDRADMEMLSGIVKNLSVEKIIVGYPIRVDGTKGIQCEKVDRFINRIESFFLIPIMRWDETFSTKDAEDILRAHDYRSYKKRKNIIDRIAASVILQSFLDFQSRRNSQK
jgi:putative holliday junction resolvase